MIKNARKAANELEKANRRVALLKKLLSRAISKQDAWRELKAVCWTEHVTVILFINRISFVFSSGIAVHNSKPLNNKWTLIRHVYRCLLKLLYIVLHQELLVMPICSKWCREEGGREVDRERDAQAHSCEFVVFGKVNVWMRWTIKYCDTQIMNLFVAVSTPWFGQLAGKLAELALFWDSGEFEQHLVFVLCK